MCERSTRKRPRSGCFTGGRHFWDSFQRLRAWTKALQVHSDTNPPICNSVHSNKVTPTEANSLSLTGRRTQTWHILTFKNSSGLSPRSASAVEVVTRNFSHLFQCRLLRLSPPQTSGHSVCSQSPASPRAVKLVAATRGISGSRLSKWSYVMSCSVVMRGLNERRAAENDEWNT